MTTPPKGTLPEIGALLFGPQWQSPLARAVGVSIKTAQNWASGDREPSHVVWARIADLITERQHALVEASRRIPL